MLQTSNFFLATFFLLPTPATFKLQTFKMPNNFQGEPRWIRLTQYNEPAKPIINYNFHEHSFGVLKDMDAIMSFVDSSSAECIKVPKGECAAFFDHDDDNDPTHFVTRLPDQDSDILVRKLVSSLEIKNQIVSWLELIKNMYGYENMVTIVRMPVKEECLKNPNKQTYIVIALEYWSDDDEDGDDDGDVEDGDHVEDLNEDFNNNLNLDLDLEDNQDNEDNLDNQDNLDNMYEIPEWFG